MILLTGASGLLGAHLLAVGLERGLSFRAVSRSPSARSFLSTLGSTVERVSVDLAGNDELPEGLFAGVDAVVHAAGLASSRAEDEGAMHALHVEATRRLCAAAVAAGVERWVQVSTTRAAGESPYARSKAAGDRVVDAFAKDLSVLRVRPAFMLGPWDARPSSGALFAALRLGRLRHGVDVNKNVVGARTVANGIVAALERRARGDYVLGGVDVRFLPLANDVARLLRVPPLIALEAFPLAAPSGMSDTEFRLLREFFEPSPAGATSSSKAERDFGYDPTTDASALVRETLDYFDRARIVRPAPVDSGERP